MTNKDIINSILNDTDKLVNFLVEPSCAHCYYYVDSSCIDYGVDAMTSVCVDGIKRWLASEVPR